MRDDKLIFRWRPLREVATTRKPRVRRAQFGDGYAQRSKDGINNDLISHTLKFRGRDSIIDEIDLFLKDRGAVESFLFSLKGGHLRLYTCEEWNRSEIDFNSSEISATFQEVVN